MGIKVWIMKGEVYEREIFLHLLEWTRNKLAGGDSPRGKSNFNKGGKPDAKRKYF
jgi:small subunit ribosomal protein S3